MVLGRLVVSPIATVAVLATAVRVGVIPATDRLLLLFLLMQGATPSAMFLGVMTQMHHDAEREAIMSQLLFVLNIAAIPLFTVSHHYATNRLLWPGVFCSCYGCCTTHVNLPRVVAIDYSLRVCWCLQCAVWVFLTICDPSSDIVFALE